MANSVSFDSNIWYRFTSNSSNAGRALDGDSNGLPNGYEDLIMQPLGSYTGQYWQLSSQPSGYYQLCSMWLGPDYRLGYYVDNASTYHPALFTGQSRDASNEQWNVTSLGDGVFSLVNQDVSANTQSPLYLDVAGTEPILGGENYGDNWGWIITEIQPIDNESYSSVSSGAATSSFVLSSSASTASATSSIASPVLIKSLTQTPTSSVTAAPVASAPASASAHRTPTGTAVGVGVGVGVGVVVVLLCALGVYIFLRRRRRRVALEQHDNGGATAAEQSHPEGKADISTLEEKYDEPHAELPADRGNEKRFELGGSQMAGEHGSKNLPELP